jgi:hypothetical protein
MNESEFEALVDRVASAIYESDYEYIEPPAVPLLALPHPDVIGTYRRRARVALKAAGIGPA